MIVERPLQQPHLSDGVGAHGIRYYRLAVGRRHLRPLLEHQIEQRRSRGPLGVGESPLSLRLELRIGIYRRGRSKNPYQGQQYG